MVKATIVPMLTCVSPWMISGASQEVDERWPTLKKVPITAKNQRPSICWPDLQVAETQRLALEAVDARALLAEVFDSRIPRPRATPR